MSEQPRHAARRVPPELPPQMAEWLKDANRRRKERPVMRVEFDLPDGYTLGDWALVLQCLDEDGDDRLVLRFSESISGTLQYGLLGQGFDAVRADQTRRWESP